MSIVYELGVSALSTCRREPRVVRRDAFHPARAPRRPPPVNPTRSVWIFHVHAPTFSIPHDGFRIFQSGAATRCSVWRASARWPRFASRTFGKARGSSGTWPISRSAPSKAVCRYENKASYFAGALVLRAFLCLCCFFGGREWAWVPRSCCSQARGVAVVPRTKRLFGFFLYLMWVRTTGPISFLKERRPYPRGVQSFFLLPFSSLPPSLLPSVHTRRKAPWRLLFRRKKECKHPQSTPSKTEAE